MDDRWYEDRTVPYNDLLGVQVLEAADGHASGCVELGTEHSSTATRRVAHGGLICSLVDTVGGAAVISEIKRPPPTIDLHVDFLNPATGDLYAEGEVVRLGSETALASVDVSLEDAEPVAEGRAIYKTGTPPDDSPWD